MQNPFWPRFARYVLPALLWMGFIFYLSTDNGSADHTRPVVHEILRRFFPLLASHMSPQAVDEVDVLVRKGAHITVYLVLGLLLYRAFRFGRRDFRNRYPVLTLVCGLLYASSDEIHQIFVPSRGPSVIDVSLDMVGVSVATMLSLWRQCRELAAARFPAPKDGPKAKFEP